MLKIVELKDHISHKGGKSVRYTVYTRTILSKSNLLPKSSITF